MEEPIAQMRREYDQVRNLVQLAGSASSSVQLGLLPLHQERTNDQRLNVDGGSSAESTQIGGGERVDYNSHGVLIPQSPSTLPGTVTKMRDAGWGSCLNTRFGRFLSLTKKGGDSRRFGVLGPRNAFQGGVENGSRYNFEDSLL